LRFLGGMGGEINPSRTRAVPNRRKGGKGGASPRVYDEKKGGGVLDGHPYPKLLQKVLMKMQGGGSQKGGGEGERWDVSGLDTFTSSVVVTTEEGEKKKGDSREAELCKAKKKGGRGREYEKKIFP